MIWGNDNDFALPLQEHDMKESNDMAITVSYIYF